MSDNLKTYEVFMREAANSIKVVRHTCQATNIREAQKIFEETYGTGRVVAGPNLVKPS
jgi:hypothetical protein